MITLAVLAAAWAVLHILPAIEAWGHIEDDYGRQGGAR